jgi:hypothetical protein
MANSRIKPWTGLIKSTANDMNNTVLAKFNVAEITEYGNGGGSKVVLLPARISDTDRLVDAKIEIHFPIESPFNFGIYDVTFAKEGAVRKPCVTLEETHLTSIQPFMEQIEKLKAELTAIYEGYHLAPKVKEPSPDKAKCPDPDCSTCHAELNATSPPLSRVVAERDTFNPERV